MTRIHLRVPTAAPDERVADVRDRVTRRAADTDSITYVYILDATRRPIGVASLAELFRANGTARVEGIMERHVVTAHASTPPRRVAALAIRHGIKAVPVVNGDGALVGVVGTDAILAALHHAHVEDTLVAAGIRRLHAHLDAERASLLTLLHHRLPWLLVGLLGAMGTTLIVRAFDGVLADNRGIAAFIPLIVYMAAALGVQTQTLYIRALAVDRVTVAQYAARECAVAGAIACASAIPLFAFALLTFRSVALAMTVSIALIMAMLVAVLLALTVTTLLSRMKRDPAFGSGPIATVLQDAASLAIYFAIASAIVL